MVFSFRFSVFSDELEAWAASRDDVRCVILVGSHARGDARLDSDIDLAIVADEPSNLLHNREWLSRFGGVVSVVREDYDRVQSLRIVYASGMEVEFGITDRDWLAQPLDEGTKEVIASGAVAIYDPHGWLAKATPSTG